MTTAIAPGPATSSPTYAQGFESLTDEVTVGALPLSGSLPAWLQGSLLRTGPAKFEAGASTLRHWFDGLAMLHRFTVDDGQVSYANRFLRSRAYEAAEGGRIGLSEFGTDPCRSLFRRVQTLFSPQLTDNGNVNVAMLGDRHLAMTETPIALEFDAQTLATAGVGAALQAPGQLTTAHPHADRATGAMLNYAAKLGPRSTYRFFRVDPDTTEPSVVASLPVREPAYMHSFGLTERYFVLAEFPFVVNPLRLATSGRPYIENFRWRPELGTRFTLVDRATGRAGAPLTTDPCFAFHHVNAYEEGDEVVVDLSAYDDAGLIEDLYLDRLRAGKPVPAPELRRFRLRPSTGEVRSERLTDTGIELARINYGRCNGRPYRYAWGAANRSGWFDTLVKADVVGHTTVEWSEPGCWPGEPVFVAEPGAATEDAGVLLSVVLDESTSRSFLLVLDAGDMSELARAQVPHHVPFSFHGQFARA